MHTLFDNLNSLAFTPGNLACQHKFAIPRNSHQTTFHAIGHMTVFCVIFYTINHTKNPSLSFHLKQNIRFDVKSNHIYSNNEQNELQGKKKICNKHNTLIEKTLYFHFSKCEKLLTALAKF